MKKILVVDDSLEIRAFLQTILNSDGHDTYLASSGREAMCMLDLVKMDLIVSDLEMEDGDGKWLLDQLSQKENPPRVIILSGDIMASEEVLKASGATAFFPKPLAVPSFMSYLSSLLT